MCYLQCLYYGERTRGWWGPERGLKRIGWAAVGGLVAMVGVQVGAVYATRVSSSSVALYNVICSFLVCLMCSAWMTQSRGKL